MPVTTHAFVIPAYGNSCKLAPGRSVCNPLLVSGGRVLGTQPDATSQSRKPEGPASALARQWQKDLVRDGGASTSAASSAPVREEEKPDTERTVEDELRVIIELARNPGAGAGGAGIFRPWLPHSGLDYDYEKLGFKGFP